MLRIDFAGDAQNAPALAVAVYAGGLLSPTGRGDARAVALAKGLPSIPRFKGENAGEGEVALAHGPGGWLAMIGMGERTDLDEQRLRAIGGALFAELAAAGFPKLWVALDLDAMQTAEVAYGMRLRAWRPAARYRSKEDPEEAWTLAEVVFVVADRDTALKRFSRLDCVARGVLLARDLVVAPGGELTPPAFAGRLGALEKAGVGIEEMNARTLEKKGLNLLLAVGQGSAHPPRLILLRWNGGTADDKPLVFVGKGITFDAGGICIKDDEDMDEMKGDMAGAAAVCGALYALALRRAPVNAIGVLAIAENMPSGRAARPGDIVKSFAGLTVEIVDTDAEGRLALADALAYAAHALNPALMVDLATLTGAVETTLGKEMAGLFADDDKLAAELLKAGEAEDEPLWRLPLTDYYDEALKSPAADLRNCTWEEHAPDALHAARFLQHFVPGTVPWAHLDIAGTSELEEDGPLAGEGPTGFGVRLLDHLADQRRVE